MKKIAIFVDVQNIYYTTQQIYKRNLNYNKFWDEVTKDRHVVAAIAYAIARSDQKQIHFQNILRKIGFKVKLKSYIKRRDGSAKGDWDVGITIDILKHAKNVDRIILASGDGDFDLLLHEIKKEYGTESEIYGVEQLTANALKKNCTQFYKINEKFLI